MTMIETLAQSQPSAPSEAAIAPFKCNKLEYLVTKSHLLDEYIENYFGQSFLLIADLEMGGDFAKEMDIDGELGEYELKAVEKFKASGKGSLITRALLNYLAAQGMLEKGRYLITD
jgi:hypothetical protein